MPQENLRCLDVKLDADDMATIASLDRGQRFNDPKDYWDIDIFA